MNYSKQIVIFLLVGVILFWGSSWYAKSLTEDTTLTLQVKISEQEKTLNTLAELLNRNGADRVVADIIKDCSPENRERFDSLLNELATLNQNRLVEVEQLYDACGGFFAERKSVMAARFEREVKVYDDYVQLYDTLDDRADTTLYPVARWQQLSDLEQAQSDLLQRQVLLQGEIIDALQAGEIVAGEGIQAMLTEAQEIRDTFSVNDARIDELRESLLSL